jgi:putative PIN family toxin of toxin-antitoxin system
MIQAEIRPRVVIDTNVLLAGMVSARSPSAPVIRACENRKLLILLSRPVLSEYQHVLSDEEVIGRFPAVTTDLVAGMLRKLRYVGDCIHEPIVEFEYPRDPRDAMFIELAIAGRATHIISFDNDLLSLATDHSDAGKRFRQRLPAALVIEPSKFLARESI